MSGPLNPKATGFVPHSPSPAVIMPASTPSPTKGRVMPRFGVSQSPPPASSPPIQEDNKAIAALLAASEPVRPRFGLYALSQPLSAEPKPSRFKALFDQKYPQPATPPVKGLRVEEPSKSPPNPQAAVKISPTKKTPESPPKPTSTSRTAYQPPKDGYNATAWLSSLADAAEDEREERIRLWEERQHQALVNAHLAGYMAGGPYYPTSHGMGWVPAVTAEEREARRNATFDAVQRSAMHAGESEWNAVLRQAREAHSNEGWVGGYYYG